MRRIRRGRDMSVATVDVTVDDLSGSLFAGRHHPLTDHCRLPFLPQQAVNIVVVELAIEFVVLS
jgi:hypothetical protein